MGLAPLITRDSGLIEIIPQLESRTDRCKQRYSTTHVHLSFLLPLSLPRLFSFSTPQLVECDPIFTFLFQHGAFLQIQDIAGSFARSSFTPLPS